MSRFRPLVLGLVAALAIGCNHSLDPASKLDADGAIRVARANGEVSSWLEAHSNTGVVKQVDGEWLLLVPVPFDDLNGHAEWVKSSFEFADVVRKLGVQANAARLGDKEVWRVTFFSWLGSAPRLLEVEVDGLTGKVISVAYRGPSIP